ncbi:uncharacterized protein CC84DRAFT_939339 [Paraphaeosphaeria sporulosa]|uniref:Uncharacterized protein n=1 Tax=Paraphaeosphaeria sporulosa TaxID=1460663 RepID=A0A177C897_9PLEO|nr:uncharacterized protein CC84DRAFT_939339 [Paraphaeosphaeria sporulosa]OAG02998.1 hypothetical protein CC84DRAFT_939339 [Paraphaeosphaeria sporulosa]
MRCVAFSSSQRSSPCGNAAAESSKGCPALAAMTWQNHRQRTGDRYTDGRECSGRKSRAHRRLQEPSYPLLFPASSGIFPSSETPRACTGAVISTLLYTQQDSPAPACAWATVACPFSMPPCCLRSPTGMSSSVLHLISTSSHCKAQQKRPGLYVYTLAPYLVLRCANAKFACLPRCHEP